MKVLLLNGSPNTDGCTFTALSEVGGALNDSGVETEFLHLGKQAVRGCIGCGACAKTRRCVFADDIANRIADAISDADGLVIGSPVYFAGPNGALCAALERAFYAAGRGFSGKPGAAVVSARRAGTTAALDRLHKYINYARMPLVSSQYWCMVHGNQPEEVRQDLEGMQIMRTLGREMAWLLNGRDMEARPEREKWVATNFVR